MLALVFLAGVAVVFMVIFPIANVHIPGRGSDSADGLNLPVKEILNLRYPYNVRAYLGNPISELPGSILLSMPFCNHGEQCLPEYFQDIRVLYISEIISQDVAFGVPPHAFDLCFIPGS